MKCKEKETISMYSKGKNAQRSQCEDIIDVLSTMAALVSSFIDGEEPINIILLLMLF